MHKKFMVVVALLATLSGCKLLDSITGRQGLATPKTEAIQSGIVDTVTDSAAGKGLVYIGKDTTPAVTDIEFNKYLGQILKMYPQLGAMDLDSLPAAFKKTFLAKIIDQKIILKEALSQNYATEESFKKGLAENIKLLKEHMLVQEFEKRLVSGIEITDADVRSEYDKNKSKYVKAVGGTLVAGVAFDSEADASAFKDKVENKKVAEFISKAESSSGKFRNFGRISSEAGGVGVPDAIKEAVLKVNATPGIVTVNDDGKTWILNLSDKSKTQFYDFEEIKGQIEGYLKSQKFQGILGEKMEVLRSKYPTRIVEELLESAPKEEAKQASKGVAIAG